MVISPQTASSAILSAWRERMTSPFGKLLALGDDEDQDDQRQAQQQAPE